ncbi:MAG TPA: hypothetical protein PLY70_00605 [Saprospiraceae bacterium]|nr:hypothetical protein [Saprospiraceae bacterium]HPN69792.1 hypothetical protein [Saprospiraceae bacterium]
MQSNTVPKPLKLYIDENLPKQFAEAFNIIQSHLNKSEKKPIEVFSIKEVYEGAKDIELFQALKDENAIVLTFDRNIQRHKHERQSYIENKIGIIFLKQPAGGSSFWDTFKNITNHWEEIKQICRKNDPPFAFRQPGQNRRFEEWTYEN